MMQMSDSYNQKQSLFHAMSRFTSAVSNMEHTVMVPSLLRDVPLHHTPPTEYFQDGDMYGSYILLKSIRNHIEWGVLQGKGEVMSGVTPGTEHDPELEDDLEKQFRFHLSGLHAVLSKLTRKADTLTNRYQEEIAIRGCGN